MADKDKNPYIGGDGKPIESGYKDKHGNTIPLEHFDDDWDPGPVAIPESLKPIADRIKNG